MYIHQCIFKIFFHNRSAPAYNESTFTYCVWTAFWQTVYQSNSHVMYIYHLSVMCAAKVIGMF